MERIINTNAYDDIVLLNNFLSKNNIDIESNPELYSKITPFSKMCPVYSSTNENIKLYYEHNLKNKRVLSITSGGDHIMHAVLAGATDITAYDINHLCKYFVSLKIAMIKTYNKEDYIKHMNLFLSSVYGIKVTCYQSYHDDMKIVIINEINCVRDKLTKEEQIFWDGFISYIKNRSVESNMFCEYDLSGREEYNAYFENNNYDILKENLERVTINYVDSDIIDLPDLNLGKFDLMYTSNILDRVMVLKNVSSTSMYTYKKMWAKQMINILTLLSSLLNKNGVILSAVTSVYKDLENYDEISSLYKIEEEETHVDNLFEHYTTRFILK